MVNFVILFSVPENLKKVSVEEEKKLEIWGYYLGENKYDFHACDWEIQYWGFDIILVEPNIEFLEEWD